MINNSNQFIALDVSLLFHIHVTWFYFLPIICEVNPSLFPAEQFDFACHDTDLGYLE